MWVFSVPAELEHSNSVARAGGGRDYPELAPPHQPPSLEAPAHKSLHFLQKVWAGEGPDLSSKFQCAAKGWNQPRKPGVPSRRPLPGCPSPPPLLGGRTRRGSPRPRAVRRLAQGASFLEEISRKSAGPLASGSPPNPAGALFAARFTASRDGRGRGAEPFLLTESW